MPPSTSSAVRSQVLYAYENTTSRLKRVTDAMGQMTNHAYFVDNQIKQTSYANAVHATPTVSFTYDSVFDRLATMSDGTGTTTYGYGPYAAYSSYSAFPGSPATGAGRLAAEVKAGGAGFASYTTGFNYDELGRQTGRSIDGAANQSSVAYDALGRVSSVTNPLGTFGYDYVTPTSSQVSSTYLGNRTGLRTAYSYLPNSGDRRLQTINNLTPAGATISKFDYAYNAVGNITTWTQQTDNQTPQAYSLEYDAADQLTGAVLKDTANQAVLKTYVYGYDAAANRTTEQIDLGVTTATANKLNQIASETAGGPLRFAGTLSKPATVKINGAPAKVTGNSFVGYANVTPGTNSVTVSATDNGGTTTSNRYQVQAGAYTGKTLTYDLNGNQLSDGAGRTYEWDAVNRLTAINYVGTNQRSEFTYDGLWRRVRAVEKSGVTVTSDKRWLWAGRSLQPIEERDGQANTTSRRFFSQGELIGGSRYFYTKDHLRSVREMISADGALQARYSYGLYGERTKISGWAESAFGFTGHYFHQPSSLHSALYRSYDATQSRWLSKDPVGEEGGINLYGYVENDPVNWIDSFGLSGDEYVPDAGNHGGPHIDRYDNGKNVGRYRPDGSGIPHKGMTPPKIPKADLAKFAKACKKLIRFLPKGGGTTIIPDDEMMQDLHKWFPKLFPDPAAQY